MRYAAVLAAAALAGSAAITLAQDRGKQTRSETRTVPAPQAQTSAAPPAKDTIFARKIMMSAMAANMDEIEAMLEPGGKFETAEAREHADTISVMMMAFPHLFPVATNQWKDGAERDAATDTYASPDVWKQFPDFYARSATASKTALEASKAKTFKEYKTGIAELRTGCDGCHAAFMKADK